MRSDIAALLLPLLVLPLWGMARSRSGAWGDTALLRLGLVVLLICGEAAVILSQDVFLWTTTHAEYARASLANGNRYVSAEVSPAGFTLGRDIKGDGRSDMPEEWEVLQPEAVGLAWRNAAFFIGGPAMLCAIVSGARWQRSGTTFACRSTAK